MRKDFCLLAYTVCIGIALVAGGCNDWLDVKPKSQAESEELFSREQGFKDALTACYIKMNSTSLYGMELMVSSIEYMAQFWDFTNNNDRNAKLFKDFDYSSSLVESTFKSIYSNFYNTIVQANSVLENLQLHGEVIENEKLRKMIEAEALGIRAFCHFDILRLFGQLPQNATIHVQLPYAKTVGVETIPYYTFDDYVGLVLDDINKAQNLFKECDPVLDYPFAELNAAIREKLDAYNARKFQKKDCSRLSLFLGEEMPLLAALPATPFELCEWKQATVQFNYHIAVDKMYYSVPFQYIKEKVDVRITETTIEIFFNHSRIASHRHIYGRPGQYSTITEHMPPDHQRYLEWNGDRFRKWAGSIGINTSKVVDAILTSGKVEQQSYRSCMGLLKLAEKHSPAKLEAVCTKALTFNSRPSYKSIKNLLVSMKDNQETMMPDNNSTENTKPRGITRGARYYGGKK